MMLKTCTISDRKKYIVTVTVEALEHVKHSQLLIKITDNIMVILFDYRFRKMKKSQQHSP